MRAYTLGRSAAALGMVAMACLALPAPAYADGAWVEVNPSSIQPGYRVGVRGSCQENLNDAVAKSKAFGEVKMAPEHGFVVAAVTIPTGTKPGDYDVKLSCANGSTATTTMYVLGMDNPTKGPATGGGGTAGGTSTPLVLTGGGIAAVVAGVGLLALRRRRA
ncbi:hypothetical protein ACTMTJ_23080 [Phytohabitans sp. LJ34]|uniref:hypothetical protein n=1 Tax=Phytohabitans sp. LJ34 TaxID=3452217 RepID=UPI003F8A6683